LKKRGKFKNPVLALDKFLQLSAEPLDGAFFCTVVQERDVPLGRKHLRQA
jgi:hypothetical protein